MSTFGERLRAAMLAAGGLSATELARRCAVSRQTVSHWLLMQEPELSVPHLIAVCAALRVRMRWLAVGSGPMMLYREAREISLAVEILEALPAERVSMWMAIGRWLVDNRQADFPR